MKKTRYAYVPFNSGSRVDIVNDCKTRGHNGKIEPAGMLICTVDGSEPFESNDQSMDGLYAQSITRKTAETAYGRQYVCMVLEEARGRAA